MISAERAFNKIVKFLFFLPSNAYNKLIFLISGVTCGYGFESRGRIFVKNKGEIIISNNVRINSSQTSNPIGVGSRTFFQVLNNGKLFIGSGTGISNTAITCAELVRIGENVRIGSGCKIYDTNFHSLNPFDRTTRPENQALVDHSPIIIDDYAFIGAGCYILKGSEIGFASIIGAGSVVSGKIPPFNIWAGNPAKFIRELNKDELKNRFLTT